MSTQFTNRQWRLPNNENKDKQSNYSMDFDGSSQYIDLGSTTFIDTSSSFTISGWYKNDGLASNDFDNTFAFKTNLTASFVGYINNYTSGGGYDPFCFGLAGNSTFKMDGGTIPSGWFHLCLVYDGNGIANTTSYTLYINNQSQSLTTAGGMSGPNNINHIGEYNSGNYFDGQIDAVAIYNYALSSSQVTTLYGSSSTGIGNPMSLSPKPVAYYPLGDQDAFNGASYLTPNASLKDFVFSFDGSSDRVYGPSGVFSNQTATTISFWVNPDSLTGVQNLFSNGAYPYFRLYFNTGNSTSYLWVTWPVSGSNNFTPFVSGMTAGKWHLFVFKWESGSKYQIYIDNDLKGESASTITGTYTDTDSLEIGNAPSNQGLQGKISNFKTWDVALTTSELTTLYNNGSPIQTLSSIPQNSDLKVWYKLDASATYDSSTTTWTIEDSSTNSNDGTSSGMTQANLVQSDLSFTSGYSPYALDFDSASSDAITLGNTIGNGFTQITCSIWANISTSGLTQSSYRNFLVKFPSGSGSATPFELRSNNGNRTDSYNNKLFFRINTNTGAYGFTDTGFEFTEANKWHHLVGTYDGSNVKLFVDGVEYYSISANGTLNSNNDNALIGYHPYGNFNGKLSNASIWNTALTSAQISELYNEGVPSNLNNHSAYSNLVSWWQLGSNSSFNSTLNQWTCIDEKGTNTGESSQTFNEDAIVDGVGSYANGLSSGMGGDEVVGDAPYSTANSLSVNMDVLDRVTDTPS